MYLSEEEYNNLLSVIDVNMQTTKTHIIDFKCIAEKPSSIGGTVDYLKSKIVDLQVQLLKLQYLKEKMINLKGVVCK